MKLLQIDSSALGAYSVSRQLTRALAESWQRNDPSLQIVHRDLAANPLPHWAPSADASHPAALANQAVLDEFLGSDVIIIGAPMYNFSIPSVLKAWIDRIVVAGQTFRYGASGPEGLAGGRKVIVVSARGGRYEQGSAFDFQESYLRHVFGFIGITDLEFVRAEGLNLGAEHKEKAINDAHAEIGTHLPHAA